jgi:hypothetical protein
VSKKQDMGCNPLNCHREETEATALAPHPARCTVLGGKCAVTHLPHLHWRQVPVWRAVQGSAGERSPSLWAGDCRPGATPGTLGAACGGSQRQLPMSLILDTPNRPRPGSSGQGPISGRVPRAGRPLLEGYAEGRRPYPETYPESYRPCPHERPSRPCPFSPPCPML